MEVILLESFDKLGKIGDTVNVKDGFARNFLLPQKKALRANDENKKYYEKIKKELNEKNKKLIDDCNKTAVILKKTELIFIRQASDSGQLYGSVSPKENAIEQKKSIDENKQNNINDSSKEKTSFKSEQKEDDKPKNSSEKITIDKNEVRESKSNPD